VQATRAPRISAADAAPLIALIRPAILPGFSRDSNDAMKRGSLLPTPLDLGMPAVETGNRKAITDGCP
jgi:hypothetical protein